MANEYLLFFKSVARGACSLADSMTQKHGQDCLEKLLVKSKQVEFTRIIPGFHMSYEDQLYKTTSKSFDLQQVKNLEEKCYGCGQVTKKLHVCTSCRRAQFCSEACQQYANLTRTHCPMDCRVLKNTSDNNCWLFHSSLPMDVVRKILSSPSLYVVFQMESKEKEFGDEVETLATILYWLQVHEPGSMLICTNIQGEHVSHVVSTTKKHKKPCSICTSNVRDHVPHSLECTKNMMQLFTSLKRLYFFPRTRPIKTESKSISFGSERFASSSAMECCTLLFPRRNSTKLPAFVETTPSCVSPMIWEKL